MAMASCGKQVFPIQGPRHSRKYNFSSQRARLYSDINFWLKCIREWYPDLNEKTYFLPPVHFNRVLYSIETIEGQAVLVPREVEGNQTCAPNRPALSNSGCHSQAIRTSCSSSMLDSDVRDDRAKDRVLHCLRAMADNIQPKETMMVVSELQFGQYLHMPCYAAAAAALLPRPRTLPKQFRQGDFDVLIIHRQQGLIIGEIKSVGANFAQLKLSEEQQNDSVLKKLKRALKQLKKAETLLRHLVSDLAGVCITKTLIMPNVESKQLLQAMKHDTDIAQEFCHVMGVHDVAAAVQLCLCADHLSSSETPWYVPESVLTKLFNWWRRLVHDTESKVQLTSSVYQQLVARICGPATTVEVHCVTSPRLQMKTHGDGVSETGKRMARLVLFPEQVDLLHASPPGVFLVGPPGTGKTVLLILQGLSWQRRGYDVIVLSTWTESRSASIAIEHHLRLTQTNSASHSPASVHRLHYDFENNADDPTTAVNDLAGRSLCSPQQQLCVLADEVGPDFSNSNVFSGFCDLLMQAVPTTFLWVAGLQAHMKPACLSLVTMTRPLRLPPVVAREVELSREVLRFGQISRYTYSTSAVETDGQSVMCIIHREGHSGHQEAKPEFCEQCGREVAQILKDLRVGLKAICDRIPPLHYRDVFVLLSTLRQDWIDCDCVMPAAIGLVRGLRECHVPARVVEFGADETALRDLALAESDVVMVTHRDNVRGLERKVVFTTLNSDNLGYTYNRLHAPSRCSAQLVFIVNDLK